MGDSTIFSSLFEFFSKSWALFTLSCILHWLLVAVHITLVFLQQHPPHPINITDTSINIIYFVVTTIPTAMFKAYAIVLALLTQRLAFSHDFRRGVALSSFGDKSSAWIGLGSALTALWNQKRARTEPIMLLLILIYLGCIFGLGLTTPSMIHVAPITSGEPLYIYTTYYLSQVGVSDVVEGFPLVSMLNMLSEGGTVDTYGLEDNTIYDITQTGGRGTLDVSAVWFEVKCGYIDGLQQSAPGQYSNQSGTVEYAFHVDDNLADISVSPAPGSINIVSAQTIRSEDLPPLTMFVASSTLFGESTGVASSVVQYSPGIAGANIGDDGSSNADFTIQILACDMHVTNGTVAIRADDNLLASQTEDESEQQSLTKWDLSAAQNESILAGLADFPTLSPPSDTVQNVQLADGSGLFANFMPTILENNVMDALRDLSDSDFNGLLVEDLESVLQEALALVYWRAQYRVYDREMAKKWNSNDVNLEDFKIGLQVQINPYMAFIGLGLSAILVVIALLLSGPVYKTRIVAKPNFVEMLLLLSGGQIIDVKSDDAFRTRSIESSTSVDVFAASKEMYIHAEDGGFRLLNRGPRV